MSTMFSSKSSVVPGPWGGVAPFRPAGMTSLCRAAGVMGATRRRSVGVSLSFSRVMHVQIAPFTHHGLVDHETEVLRGFLDVEREHVLGILEGFSEEQLRLPMLPSGWNGLGMVKHLALSDEHYWFQCVVAGESFDSSPRAPTPTGRWGPMSRPRISSACTGTRSPARTPSSRPPRSSRRRGSSTRAGGSGGRGSPTSGSSCCTCSRNRQARGPPRRRRPSLHRRQWIVLGEE